MARLVSLGFRGGWAALVVAGLGVLGFPPPVLRAQGQAAPAPVKSPATDAVPVTPPAPDTLNRYGKILMPSDEATHPLKLKLPLPGAGEVKVPTPDELNMREKLEQLAKLSDEEIHTQLEQWPAFGKMSLRDQGLMLQRIQDFRDYRSRVAAQKAHDLGLLMLTPDQKVRFEKEYWDKRIKMDHDLAKQLAPIFNARQQKMEDELFREFSTSPGPIALGPKPPAPTVPPAGVPPGKTPDGAGAAQPVVQGQK